MQTATSTTDCPPVTGGHGNTKSQPKTYEKVELFGLRAIWLHFANERELRRLAKLHVRIRRREDAIRELKKERREIMECCKKRSYRARKQN
ncbi:hypothetical protein [Leisingera sp. M523]|uniref:hypothetical protein n=1 Tax=Leisingera sp. M523 TaxID=2867013 RepID=UPI0021A71FFB|nr:hypothetical protein [Leisingera sp. M523]UWQ29892.1 hypothetical protein K3557_04905 [Leisingera sp. M523]